MRRSVTALQLGTCLGTAGLLVLGATPALAASATPAATADRPMPAPARINLPLVFSGTFLGDVGAQIALDGSGLALDPADFVRLAGDRLTPTMKARIQGARGSSGLVTAEEFKAAGVEVAYDPATLEVSVSIPLDQQGRRSLALVQEATVFDSDYDPPTGFSGTGIFNVSQNVSHEQGWFGDFQPVNVAAQTAFNLGGAKGLNLFAEMFYGGGEGGLRRGAVTLTRDDRDRALRLMAGDISPTTAGFQSSLPIGGIGIEKNYSQLPPYSNVRTSGPFKFALDEPAVVEVLVNGVVARAFRLERGQYDVRDFNFASGLNRIDIYVVDDYGRRLLTSFSQFFNFNLLDPGISEFGAYAGFPQLRSGAGSIAYGGDPTLTLFYRGGLTQSLTAGFDFQAGGAHAPRRVTVRAETLPDGYDPGKSYYELLPGPATGYLAQVGSDASRTVQGNLIDGSGAPIGLAVGDLVRIDKAGGKKIQIFTNRTGRFVATGLSPGRYRLEIGADRLIAELVVGEDQDGIIEVGRVSARQEER